MFPAAKAYAGCAMFLAGLAASGTAWSQTVTAGQLSATAVDVTKPAASPVVMLHIRGQASLIQLEYTGPSGEFLEQRFSGTFTGTVELQGYASSSVFQGPSIFSLFTEPGQWSLASVSVCNATFQCTGYSGSRLAALFNTLAVTVTNPNSPDITPPRALAAAFSQSSISSSPATAPTAAIRVTDDVSGVASVSIAAQNTVSPQDQIYFSSATPTRPVTSGVLTLSSYVPQGGFATGTYKVTSIFLSDNAGNSSAVTDAAKISQIFRGADTIKVTK